MTNLKVSIVMPSFNASRYIGEAIESVLSQTHTNWELIIVDDCSSDDTVEKISEYASKDPRIKYFTNQKNQGAAYSRNFALRQANGEYVAFLDCDDKWDRDKLFKQLMFMELNNYNFSYTKYSLIDKNSNEIGILMSGPPKITKKMMIRCCYPGCLTVMYKREILPTLQIPDSIKKRNDYAMWILLSQKSNCYLLDENLAKYRKTNEGISSVSKYKLFKNHVIMFKELLKFNTFHAYCRSLVNVISFFVKYKKYRSKINN